jgi:hypothetical protein
MDGIRILGFRVPRRHLDFPTVAELQKQYASAYREDGIAAFVYHHLGIIDAKTGAVLRYNGILIATLGLMARNDPGAASAGAPVAYWASLVALALLFASTAMALFTQWLFFYRLEGLETLVAVRAEGCSEKINALGRSHVMCEREQGFYRLNLRSLLFRICFVLSCAGTAPAMAAILAWVIGS